VNCGRGANGNAVQSALNRAQPIVELPAGQTRLDQPLVFPKGAHNIQLRGNPSGSTLVLNQGFKDAAAILIDDASNITLSGFSILGDRTDLKTDLNLPTREAAFADYYPANGIVVRASAAVTIRNVRFSRIRSFPVIINSASKGLIDSVTVEDSGTLNRDGHNNTTGGILLEEGSTNFEVRDSTLSRVTGNAIWTHSYARSPRQSDGIIRGNTISTVARDAIQIGHATRILVANNHGSQIGFPVDYVDFPGYATPVAIDTAGNVDGTTYRDNEFTAIAGQCIDLDGFHDGSVTGNTCTNDPAAASQWLGLHFGILFGNHDPAVTSANVIIARNSLRGFAYGGLFLIGEHNLIEANHFLDVNLAHCGTQPVLPKCNALTDQPDALRSGIYLSDDGGRPTTTRNNIIRDNVIEGFGMAQHCIAAKKTVSLKSNTISGNLCH
jgi:hypothetical protein